MARPSLVVTGTGYTDAGGAWEYTGPISTAQYNVYIFQILQDGTTDGAVTGVSGINILDLAGTENALTLIPGSNADGSHPVGSAARQFLYICRASANGAYPAISGSNSTSEDLYIRAYQFTDVSTGTTLATVCENSTGTSASGAGTSATATVPDITTLGFDRLALAFTAVNDDNVVNVPSGGTGGSFKVERYAESSGTDGAVAIAYGYPNTQTWTAGSLGSNNLADVAYGNGYWVACDSAGVVWVTSDPTGSWSSRDIGGLLNGVTYGNGYWVAVGDGGAIYYTTDPTGTWTLTDQGTVDYYAVHFGNNYFVAVGAAGAIHYKVTDPTGTWNTGTFGSYDFTAVTFDDGWWVAVGDSGTTYYRSASPNGLWGACSGATADLKDVCFGDPYFVAVGISGALYIMNSPAIGWSSNTQGSAYLYAVRWVDGLYRAMGASGTELTSTTGSGTWNSGTTGSADWLGLAVGNGYSVAVGTGGALVQKYNNTATTITGFTSSIVDSDAWGVVSFALIGTTVAAVSNPQPRRVYPQLLAH